MQWNAVMLGGNGIKHVLQSESIRIRVTKIIKWECVYLHDERTQILCDEIENEIVSKLLNVPMVGVVEGGRDLPFVYNSFSSVVYG